jgi:hypothetical protein
MTFCIVRAGAMVGWGMDSWGMGTERMAAKSLMRCQPCELGMSWHLYLASLKEIVAKIDCWLQ